MYDALRASIPSFTERQVEVIELIAAGCSNDEVGERLGISPRTAKAHSDVLRQKLGVTRRRAAQARRHGSARRATSAGRNAWLSCVRAICGAQGRRMDQGTAAPQSV